MEIAAATPESRPANVCQASALGDLIAVKDACEHDSSYVNLPDDQV